MLRMSCLKVISANLVLTIVRLVACRGMYCTRYSKRPRIFLLLSVPKWADAVVSVGICLVWIEQYSRLSDCQCLGGCCIGRGFVALRRHARVE